MGIGGDPATAPMSGGVAAMDLRPGLGRAALRSLGMEEHMDLAAQFEALQERSSEASSAVRAATAEPRERVWQRIDQAQVEVNAALTDPKQDVGLAANRAP